MTTPTPKDIGNLIYHSAVIGGLAVGYSMIFKKVVHAKAADLGRLNFEDSAKLVGTIALSLYTQDMLVKQGIIPASIIKNIDSFIYLFYLIFFVKIQKKSVKLKTSITMSKSQSNLSPFTSQKTHKPQQNGR